MSDKGGGRIPLFVGFVVVFVAAFAFGIYLGKQMGVPGESVVVTPEIPEMERKGIERPRPAGVVEKTAPVVPTPPAPEEKGELLVERLPAKPSPAPLYRETPPTVEPTLKLEEAALPTPTPRAAVVKPKPSPRPRKVAALPRITARGRYTVQVASFGNERVASMLAQSLLSRGYPAFVTKATIEGKGTWYRVRVGTFATRQEAKRYGEILRSREPLVKEIYVTVNK